MAQEKKRKNNYNGAHAFAVTMAVFAGFFVTSALYTKNPWMWGAATMNALMSIGGFIDAQSN